MMLFKFLHLLFRLGNLFCKSAFLLYYCSTCLLMLGFVGLQYFRWTVSHLLIDFVSKNLSNKIQLLAKASFYLWVSSFKSLFPSFSKCLLWVSLLYDGGGNFAQLPYCWRKSKMTTEVTMF
ncbi:hypothetical protein L873DRAFT_824046 [Choiromyces venosus 120613-1]|uniref:Uncharacterized protein n=1 Tax=Choiromyces venosus 120613-1 TaxID=1336337 RepID=A0A3N4JTF8_9PEZI|nr:hypothetical protein L873DRAFT_824046 [Choiromyces venosus 120613-1]